MLIWNIMGASAVVLGLIIGPRLHTWSHSNPWLSVVLALALYAGTALLCPVILMRLWRKPDSTPVVLLFSIPIGAVGIGLILFLRATGPTILYYALREQYGLYMAVGLLYAASLMWAIAVTIQRKRLGRFDV